MNVRVRFLSVATLVALASGAIPLAAQSGPSGEDAGVSPAPAPPSLITPPPIVGSGARLTRGADVDSATATVRGPSVSSARIAARHESTTRGAPPVLQNRSSNRNAVALMIVGGAALVVGAVIGDDAGTLVMLGGAAVGLYGLYMFLT